VFEVIEKHMPFLTVNRNARQHNAIAEREINHQWQEGEPQVVYPFFTLFFYSKTYDISNNTFHTYLISTL
jgi:hypothetical protein